MKVYQDLEAILSQSESVYGNQVVFDKADANLIVGMAFADTKAVTNTFNQNNKYHNNTNKITTNPHSICPMSECGDSPIGSSPEKKHHFMVKLMEKCGHSCIEFVSSNWCAVKLDNNNKDIKLNNKLIDNDKIVEPIYTRQLTIKTTPQSRFSLFPKKNSQFEIKQTKIELETGKLTTLYVCLFCCN